MIGELEPEETELVREYSRVQTALEPYALSAKRILCDVGVDVSKCALIVSAQSSGIELPDDGERKLEANSGLYSEFKGLLEKVHAISETHSDVAMRIPLAG